MLPNESLLVVLYFVDYRTLVLAKLAGAPFLRLAIRFTNELARRRRFCVTFFSSWITYEEAPMGARRSIRYERGNQPSLLSACRELNGVAGPHAVDKVMFSENTWNIPYVDVVFEAASPLKHAEDVLLNSRAGSATVPNFEAFTSNFAGMKTLRLWLDCDVFDGFSWAFLRQESARGLRLLKVSYKDSWATRADVRSSVEELVGCCGTLPHLHGGEALVLDFSENHVSSGLVLRIIEMLKGSGSQLTLRMVRRDDDAFVLGDSDYSVHFDGKSTRYTSEKSSIAVEVTGLSVIIRSTADAPATKRSRVAIE